MKDQNTIIDKLCSYSFNELVVEEFFDFTKLFKYDGICSYDSTFNHIKYSNEIEIATTKTIKNNILVDYHTYLPRVTNLYTALINVNETIHCLMLESNLGRNVEDSDLNEVLPTLFEELFINYLNANKGYNLNELYESFKLYRKEKFENINGDKKIAYTNALLMQDQLLDIFRKNPHNFMRDIRNVVKGRIKLENFITNHDNNKQYQKEKIG